jgi:excisionase family DNA binding protein
MKTQINRKPERPDKLTYSVKETRALLGLGRDGVYNAIKRREIPSIRIGGRIVIPKTALHRMLDDGTTAASKNPASPSAQTKITRASDGSA